MWRRRCIKLQLFRDGLSGEPGRKPVWWTRAWSDLLEKARRKGVVVGGEGGCLSSWDRKEIRERGLTLVTHFRSNGKKRIGFKSPDCCIGISEKNGSASNQLPYSSL